MNKNWNIYRESTLGKMLDETIKELDKDQLLDSNNSDPKQKEEIIDTIWKIFDQEFQNKINLISNQSKWEIKGICDTYQHRPELDVQVCNLIVKEASITCSQQNNIIPNDKTLKVFVLEQEGVKDKNQKKGQKKKKEK